MKSAVYLTLPIVATVFNMLLALQFNQRHSNATAQPARAVINHIDADRCLDNLGGVGGLHFENFLERSTDPYEVFWKDAIAEKSEAEEEEDPMLKLMPGTDFKAFVRADIATFYGHELGSMKEKTPSFTGQAGKFINMSPDRVSLYWDGPSEPLLNTNLGPWESGGTACYATHKFIMTKLNKPNEVICLFLITKGTSVYYCDPFSEESHTKDSHANGLVPAGQNRSTDELSGDNLDEYAAHVYNLEFGELYKNFTGGSEWLSMYPRNPPKNPIWRADYFGQEHHVQTQESQFLELPPKKEMHILSTTEMVRNENSPVPYSEHRAPGSLNLTLTALSVAPRAFEIQHFLSDTEVDHILYLVRQAHLERSTTNGHLSSTRTSSTTWVNRHADHVVDTIFRRVADALRLDEALLRHRLPEERMDLPTTDPINEALQIVHYDKGQEYTAHHDFGYPDGTTDSPSRSINFCMYLNDVEEGGETSFPRWRNAETSASLDVKPEKGKAVIFYMVNPDGNLDDLTQHAANPVLKGEKWFANLWIWDPRRI